MAAVTLTYTANMSRPACAPHTGVQALLFDFNSGATDFGTVSDVALLGKLPAHCEIVGGYIRCGARNTTDPAHYMLLAVDANAYATSGGTVYGSFTASAGGVTTFTLGMPPVKISLSADSTASHAVLYLNCTTGTTASGSQSLQGVILYKTSGFTI